MIGKALIIVLVAFASAAVEAQPAPKPSPTPIQTRPSTPFNLADYGVQVQPDARLIVMMAALDAAGFDPTPAGKEPSSFRRLVRKDQASLEPGLRERMKKFFELNK